MAGKAFTVADAEGAKFDIISEGDRGSQAVHDVVTAMRANRRQGTASTKTRGEVSASNRKPWRQKGTGRARAGRTSSPIWTGGGTVFGPLPRDYSKDVNKKTRRLAFRRALGGRIADGDVLSSGDIAIADGKTKSFVKEIAGLTDAAKVLVIGRFDETTYRAARNVQPVLLITPEEVNVEQVLYYHKIIITDGALEALAQRTAKASPEPSSAPTPSAP